MALLKVGTPVRIIAGPYAGRNGTVHQLDFPEGWYCVNIGGASPHDRILLHVQPSGLVIRPVASIEPIVGDTGRCEGCDEKATFEINGAPACSGPCFFEILTEELAAKEGP